MSVGEVYQVKVFQRYRGAELLNVFYYGQAAGAAGDNADDLQVEFLADVWAAVRSCLHADNQTYRITVINGMRNGDAVDVALDLDGTHLQGAGLMTNLALACRSPKGTPGLRYSYKRFGGIPNELTSAAVWAAAYRAIIVAMTDNLGSAVESAAALYSPVQIAVNPALGPPAWRLGVAPIIGRGLSGVWQFNNIPSHQDTRQQYDWQIS